MPLPALLLAAALLPSAEALRALPRPDALCRTAELVVVAEVTGQEAHWGEGDLGGIETWSDLAVIETLRGAPPSDTRVVAMGGTLGALHQRVEDQAELQEDRRYLLLLVAVPQGGWRVVGGPDGVLPISLGPGQPGVSRDDAVTLLAGCLDG